MNEIAKLSPQIWYIPHYWIRSKNNGSQNIQCHIKIDTFSSSFFAPWPPCLNCCDHNHYHNYLSALCATAH